MHTLEISNKVIITDEHYFILKLHHEESPSLNWKLKENMGETVAEIYNSNYSTGLFLLFSC